MTETVRKTKKRKGLWWKIPLFIVLGLLLIVLIYAAYLIFSYNRIEDNQPLTVEGKSQQTVIQTGQEYTAITYNIGFGAYTPDFTFFMDGGTQSWAKSKESVLHCINADIALLQEQKADILLLQEVDFNSTRSHHVDEVQMIRDAFGEMSSTLAVTYHSTTCPHVWRTASPACRRSAGCFHNHGGTRLGNFQTLTTGRWQ